MARLSYNLSIAILVVHLVVGCCAYRVHLVRASTPPVLPTASQPLTGNARIVDAILPTKDTTARVVDVSGPLHADQLTNRSVRSSRHLSLYCQMPTFRVCQWACSTNPWPRGVSCCPFASISPIKSC